MWVAVTMSPLTLPPATMITKHGLIQAIQHHELVLYYQPLFNLASGRFEGVEALIRWNHPSYGLLLPEHFISKAAEWGLMDGVGTWVLETACAQLQAWRAAGLPLARVAVNVHAQQLHDPELLTDLPRLLSQHQLSPDSIELELTEDIIIHDTDKHLIGTIQALKALGVSIALDDFGTGYSSINYLRQLPIDRIKIDRSYVANMLNNTSDTAIIQAMVTLAKSLNLKVVIEGVESYPQLAMLLTHLGLEVQGFYFAKPMKPDEAATFLRYYQNHSFPTVG